MANDASDLTANIHATWELMDVSIYIAESVHRLSELGAVVTQTLKGTSKEGLDVEYRMIDILTVEGDLLTRVEVFDEADLDAALARFDELHTQAPRLENAATRAQARFFAYYKAHDWAAIAEILADGTFIENRVRVVNTGLWEGRDVVIANMQALAEAVANATSAVLAVRGERLSLTHMRYPNRDTRYGEFVPEQLIIAEIDTDDRIAAQIVIDPDDIDAAIKELDARYLAGEASAHAHTWSVITEAYAAFNRHELLATDLVTVDHRRATPFESSTMTETLRSIWDVTPDLNIQIEAVHRLSSFGAVVTHLQHGTSTEGFDAEWRSIQLMTVEGDRITYCEIFDEADLDAALARFEELHPQVPRLENAASQSAERFFAYLGAQNWAAMADILADDSFSDDRRRVVNAGLWDGRDVVIAELRETTDFGVLIGISELIATRGQRLVLGRVRWSASDQGAEAFQSEALCITEVEGDGQIAAIVMFDPDDLEGAIAELDARYLAADAAAHTEIWSVIMRTYAAFNRHELPPTTPDWVNIDHRRGIAFAPGDATAYIRASQDPQGSIYVETVHRLSNLGAVFTWAGHGTSQEGFEAEWRGINVATVEGDRINRGEIFDEADLDAALARFDELQPRAPRLENAASQLGERQLAHFAARDWAAMTELLAEDTSTDDRRRVVNAGIQHGRDVDVATMRALADLGVAHIASTVIATRGERLALTRSRMSGRDQRPDAFYTEALSILEIDADNRGAAKVVFDPDDIDSAIKELDARYLAGEAADYAHTWSVMMQACAALNTREIFATTADFVDIDHRSLAAIESGDLKAYIRAALNDGVYNVYIEAVHRLGDLGAVVTLVSSGTSQGGFDGEWRMADVFTVEGDLISRCEIFNEADLDAALARFDELQPQAPRLENTASHVYERFQAHFATCDWDAIADMLTADLYSDDRRPVVGGGSRPGRDALIEDLRAVTDVEVTNATSDAIATRGGRLVLARARYSRGDGEPDPFHVDFLQLVEIDAEDRITALIAFDPDDIDAAIEALDARYLAGEAGAYAHTWSVITRFNDAFNRHEIPATDWVTIDHRRLITADTSDQSALIHEVWNITPDLSIHIEAVHRLSGVGAVVTRELHGTSQDGFDAEWRMIQLLTVEGDQINRSELFDEADLDAALARFQELQPQASRLENAAIRVAERLFASFAAGEWDSIREILANDFSQDDRRQVVGAGVRRGRDDEIADLRAIADLWSGNATRTYLATRGERLDLMRLRFSLPVQGDEAFVTEMLGVGEINAEGRIVAAIAFDPEEFDAAFAELDARYLAGEAAAHSHTWSVITQAYTALNHRKLPPAKADWVNVDHRQGIAFAPGDMTAYIRAGMDLAPDTRIYIETVHRLNSLGAVITQVLTGTSHDGFDAEWREIGILTFEGDLISRSELYDEADLDVALARFDELDRPPSS